MRNKLTIILSAVALVIAIVALLKPSGKIITQMIGAEGDTNFTNLVAEDITASGNVAITGSLSSGTFTEYGGIRATSTIGNAVPLLASDFDTENVIDVTLNVLDATLSFPATTTLTSFIPTAGQTRTLLIRNATTTAAMDLTITGGTGVLLKNATSTAVIKGDTDGANYGIIKLIRKANTDIEALLQIFVD